MNTERFALSLELATHSAIVERLLDNNLITQNEFKRICRQIAHGKSALIASQEITQQAHSRRVEEKN